MVDLSIVMWQFTRGYILMLVVFLVKQPMEFVGASVFDGNDGKPFLLHNI